MNYLYIWTSTVIKKLSYFYWYNIKFKYSAVHYKFRCTQQAVCNAETEMLSDSCCAWCWFVSRLVTTWWYAVFCTCCVTQLAFIMSHNTHRSVLYIVKHVYWNEIVKCTLSINYDTVLLIQCVILSVKSIAMSPRYILHCWYVTGLVNGLCSDKPER
jgi:hypothetical protein